jgi:hypothetical protein
MIYKEPGKCVVIRKWSLNGFPSLAALRTTEVERSGHAAVAALLFDNIHVGSYLVRYVPMFKKETKS